MTKDERLKLNELSLKVYGRSSSWRKLLDRGIISTLKRTLDDGTEETYKGYKFLTIDEVVEQMETSLKEQEAKKAKEKESVTTEPTQG